MIEWARQRSDQILTQAVSAFPDRAIVLKEIRDAHNLKLHSLVIPTLLAQCDGISMDVVGTNLFRNNPVKEAARFLDSIPDMDSLTEATLEPLRSKSAFYTTSSNARTEAGVNLANRSEVLHGLQLDYAPEPNALRAIMLLSYLIEVRELLSQRRSRMQDENPTV